MSSLFSKIRIAGLAISHGLLDKVIDLNSIQAVKQYARDLETSISDINISIAEAQGQVTGGTRKRVVLNAKIVGLDQQIDVLLSDGDESNDHFAETLQARLDGEQEALRNLNDEITAAETTVNQLTEVKSNLETRHAQMVAQIGRLESMERTAGGKERAAAAMRNAAESLTDGAGASIDNVAARIQKRSDTADALLGGAMSDFNRSYGNDAAVASVKASIAERKRRLAEAKAK